MVWSKGIPFKGFGPPKPRARSQRPTTPAQYHELIFFAFLFGKKMKKCWSVWVRAGSCFHVDLFQRRSLYYTMCTLHESFYLFLKHSTLFRKYELVSYSFFILMFLRSGAQRLGLWSEHARRTSWTFGRRAVRRIGYQSIQDTTVIVKTVFSP